jgi:hypothetical protein
MQCKGVICVVEEPPEVLSEAHIPIMDVNYLGYRKTRLNNPNIDRCHLVDMHRL